MRASPLTTCARLEAASPGFGFSAAPDREPVPRQGDLAKVIDRSSRLRSLHAIYVFDYGAPVGLRLAFGYDGRLAERKLWERPQQGWNAIQKYWKRPTPENLVLYANSQS